MNSFPCMHLTFWLARCVGVHRFPASLIPILQFELRSKLVRIGIDAFLEMLQWLLHPSIVVQAPRRQCGVARDETRIRKICHITRYQINDFYWRMKTKRDKKKVEKSRIKREDGRQNGKVGRRNPSPKQSVECSGKGIESNLYQGERRTTRTTEITDGRREKERRTG